MTARHRAILLSGLGLICFVLSAYISRDFVYDDSYISFRYAYNLAHHGELVWNLGERVEGFTNFLYTLALTPFFAAGIDPVLAARGINLAALVALLASTDRLLSALLPEGAADARAAGRLVILGAAPVAIWTMGALEAVPVAAFLMIGLERMAPMLRGERLPAMRAVLAGLAFGCACLTRLDAGALVALCLGVTFLTAQRPWSERFFSLSLVGLVLALLVGAQIVWRLSYFGEILPNTFNAKVGVPMAFRIDFGLFYLQQSALQLPLVVLALLALLLPPIWPLRGRVAFGVCAVMLLGQVGYVGWAGGDHLPAARFFIVALVPAAVVIALAYERMPEAMKSGAAVLVAFPLLYVSATLPPRFHNGAEAGLLVGAHLAETLPEGSLVALNTAGGPPFAAPNLRFLDQLGLNDRVIAERDPVPIRMPWQRRPGHSKGDGAYVLSREPDVIILGGTDGATAENPLMLGDLELIESEEFARCYTLLREVIYAPGNAWLEAVRRTDRMEFISYRRTC